jgi:hypothetical protein
VPAPAAERHRRLFDVLERAYPVRFEGRGHGEWRDLDAVVLFEDGAHRTGPPSLPTLRIHRPPETPRELGSVPVRMSASAHLHPALRDRAIVEHTAIGSLPSDTSGRHVLASDGRRPLWTVLQTSEGHVYETTAPIAELDPSQVLRDHFRPGNFMGLLPLVDFLRGIVGAGGWSRPPLPAAIVFDDPNLHWPTYGYLDFTRLAKHAGEHNYHAVVATIPLDGFHVHAAAAKVFRSAPDRLSLAIHGNDHTRGELVTVDRAGARRLGSDALRRMAAFERRSGLRVSPIMIPPHERAAEPALAGLLDAGFHGICAAPSIAMPVGALSPARAVGDWGAAQFLAGGFPLFARRPLSEAEDDLVFRAYLGQPLILYGHHVDAAGGLDRIADVAAAINTFGDVAWAPLDTVAATSYRLRRNGPDLEVGMFSLSADIPVPEDIERIVVELPASPGDGRRLAVSATPGGSASLVLSESELSRLVFDLRGAPAEHVRLRIVAADSPGDERDRRRRISVWPICRRTLTECRDRSSPLRSRITAAVR